MKRRRRHTHSDGDMVPTSPSTTLTAAVTLTVAAAALTTTAVHMEEMAPAVALPFMLGNSTPIEITRLLSDIAADPEEAVASVDDDAEDDAMSVGPEPDPDPEPEPSVGSPGSVVSDTSSLASITDDFLALDGGYELDSARIITASVEMLPGPDTEVTPVPEPEVRGRTGSRSVFLMDYVPFWGCVSLCGRRPEMEDAVTTMPWFCEIPLEMLTAERTIDGLDASLVRLPAHFFGVYDGHGGAQVADYCRDSVHHALMEKLRGGMDGNGVDWQKQWEKAFIDCFQRVDDEVGGKVSRGIVENTAESSSNPSGAPSEPVAPETVGSTAVVAVICSSHIIIANCGDSRAVLCRGKQAVALSIDHKPNREDEYARIEAEGGKVIQWNGYRVFGVLAMSRSIGDRYLKPWIIPVPEVKIVPRMKEDECLILASDGLWDVMTNEEVCDAARRRILLWHKKNGVTPVPPHRGEESDPAAQAAADYLTKLALQKGSKDNITVVVVDLKSQRKFKTKT